LTGNELGTTHIMEDDLDQALEAIARVPILLVATDYDGTLSPIVDNPDDAKPVRESIIALRALATLSGTHCAVVSGRSLSDLASLSSLDGQIMLVGMWDIPSLILMFSLNAMMNLFGHMISLTENLIIFS